MLFSYATARSLVTAKQVAAGIRARIPLIVYNGGFVVDNVTGEVLIANYFAPAVYALLEELFRRGVYPIVYARIGGEEKFSFVPALCTEGTRAFLDSRQGDVRTNAVSSAEEGYAVQNACAALKRLATGVIASNDEDGVARWLAQNYKG